MDGNSIYAHSFQPIHLVLHQGDKRSDDDAQTLARECRYLICERLTTSRWHKRKRVAPLHYGVDNRLLSEAKLAVTPIFMECGLELWPYFVAVACHMVQI